MDKKRKYFLSDDKSNGPQFSKVIVLFCLLVMVLGLVFTGWAYIYLGLSESIACAIITASGCCGITSVVWNLKKSQAENTMKMYLSAYKEIANFKAQSSNPEDSSMILQQAQDEIMAKMNVALSAAIDEATSSIERQDIY